MWDNNLKKSAWVSTQTTEVILWLRSRTGTHDLLEIADTAVCPEGPQFLNFFMTFTLPKYFQNVYNETEPNESLSILHLKLRLPRVF